MAIPTGINVNKNKRVEKMTEEEVKALIKELRDEIPEIHQKLHRDQKEENRKIYEKSLLAKQNAKENK